MGFDNRIFNVNGELKPDGEKLLLAALELAFATSGFKHAKAWRYSTTHGLILDWHCFKGNNAFPAPLDAKGVFPIVLQWMNSPEAGAVQLDKWDSDYDHDGHNGLAWRVYCEDWGHVDGRDSIVAIKRTYAWYGK